MDYTNHLMSSYNLFKLDVPGGDGSLLLLTPLKDMFHVEVLLSPPAEGAAVIDETVINLTGIRGNRFVIQVYNPCITLEQAKVAVLPEFVYAYDKKYENAQIPKEARMPRKNTDILMDVLLDPLTYCDVMPRSDEELEQYIQTKYGKDMFTLEDARAFSEQELDVMKSEYMAGIEGKLEMLHSFVKNGVILEHFGRLPLHKMEAYYAAKDKKAGTLENDGLVFDTEEAETSNRAGDGTNPPEN